MTGSLASELAGSNPTDAVANGSEIFDRAFKQAGGSIAGTATVIAGIAAGLPSGQLQQAVNKVSGALSSTEEGAAIGSVIPGYGTAIGAAAGALIGIFNDVLSGNTEPLQTDFRTQAEKYCWPWLPQNPVLGSSDSLLAQTAVNAGTWCDIRTHAPVYQLPAPIGVVDPVSGQDCPVDYTGGVGWVSPPGSTAASTEAAWALGNAWAARSWSRMGPAWKRPYDEAWQKATTLIGSDRAATRAMGLLQHWYGVPTGKNAKKDFGAFFFRIDKVNISPLGPINKDGQWDVPTISAASFYRWWPKELAKLNETCALDYLYYFAPSVYMRNLDGWLVRQLLDYESDQRTRTQGDTPCSFVGCPDTTLLGLAELACLTEMGVSPANGADAIALHYVLGLAWLWRRGQIEDQTTVQGSPIEGALPIANHPNFSRLISRLSGYQKKASSSHSSKSSKAHSKSKAAHVASTKPAARTSVHAAAAAASESAASAGAAPGDGDNDERDGAIAILAAAVLGGGLLWWKKRRRR